MQHQYDYAQLIKIYSRINSFFKKSWNNSTSKKETKTSRSLPPTIFTVSSNKSPSLSENVTEPARWSADNPVPGRFFHLI